jgi:hypothetical protein
MGRGEVCYTSDCCLLHVRLHSFCRGACCLQASDKRRIQLPEWKRKLDAVKIRKEDMNKLIMNFLVTEVLSTAPHHALAALASACGL